MDTHPGFSEALAEWSVIQMKHSMHGLFLYAKERGFSMSQLATLMHIDRKGVSGLANIGDDLGITSAAVSQMIDRLVQHDLIIRTEDPEDRRAKRLELTGEGFQVIRDCAGAQLKWIESLSGRLTIQQQHFAAEALQMLINKTKEMENKPS